MNIEQGREENIQYPTKNKEYPITKERECTTPPSDGASYSTLNNQCSIEEKTAETNDW